MVAEAPNAIEVEPTVTVLFAKLELAIDEAVDELCRFHQETTESDPLLGQ